MWVIGHVQEGHLYESNLVLLTVSCQSHDNSDVEDEPGMMHYLLCETLSTLSESWYCDCNLAVQQLPRSGPPMHVGVSSVWLAPP